MGSTISKEGFSPITLEDKKLFDDILNSCELYQDLAASEFSFQSFYCWGAYDNPLKCIIDEGIVIFYEHSFGNDNVFYAPVVKKPEYLVPVMMKIVTFCRKNGIKVHMERLTNNMAELARKHIDCRKCEVLESRRDFEYLYDPTELIKLEGKKFKNKRNFVNGFKERFQYEFLPYDNSMREELLDLVRAWGNTHDELDAQNEDLNERVLEKSIVDNIKRFILTFGQDFIFVGNQYRLEVSGEEMFVDLLFFNRELNSLVAVELKSGKFRSSYLGQLSTYLSALDTYVRKPHENPAIGILLCRDMNQSFVEFAIRDYDKPMGVATYRATKEMPERLRNALPDIEELKKLL